MDDVLVTPGRRIRTEDRNREPKKGIGCPAPEPQQRTNRPDPSRQHMPERERENHNDHLALRRKSPHRPTAVSGHPRPIIAYKSVTAPCDASLTSLMYLYSAPCERVSEPEVDSVSPSSPHTVQRSPEEVLKPRLTDLTLGSRGTQCCRLRSSSSSVTSMSIVFLTASM